VQRQCSSLGRRQNLRSLHLLGAPSSPQQWNTCEPGQHQSVIFRLWHSSNASVNAIGKARLAPRGDPSSVVPDIGSEQLSAVPGAHPQGRSRQAACRARQPALRLPGGARAEVHRHRPELLRPEAESNMPIAKEPIVFRKATSCIHCPNDPVMLPPPRAKFHEQGDCRTWPGLHHRQRRERARVPRTRYAVGEGQGCDTFDPIGPWLVTTDKITTCSALRCGWT